ASEGSRSGWHSLPQTLSARSLSVCAARVQFGIVDADDTEQLIDHDLSRSTFDWHSAKGTDYDATCNVLVDAVADANRRAELLIQSLDSRGEVYAVAHHCVAQPFTRPHIADDNGVAM